MPIYEFRCRECDAIEESFQKVNDPIPEQCASCGKRHTLEKIVSQTSFQLKGGGWYNDLYASTKPEKSTSSSSVASSSSTAESASKTETTKGPSTPSGTTH